MWLLADRGTLLLLSVTRPGPLTPVGFAAPARAGCAFIASGKSLK